MRGSDLDIMFVNRDKEVYDVKPCLHQHKSCLSMDTEDVKPGFTQLRLDYFVDQFLFENCEQFANKIYLSSKLWKQHFSFNNKFIIHGPCISDRNGLFDFAKCLHCKTWVFAARHWIARSNNSWPSYDVKQSIMRQGVLFVPIGNIYHDAVSGWLMLVTFFYKTKQYAKALRIIMYSLSKCTFDKLHRCMSDINHQWLKLKSVQNMCIVRLWKLLLVDTINFYEYSHLLPDELLLRKEDTHVSFPCSAYAYVLKFLCHYHLNNGRQCQADLDDLRLVIEEHYLMADLRMIASAYYLLGIALQIAGDAESAQRAFLLATKNT
ncbi:Hypothetical predicted protein [Mytilus galloprovincialis]|uniref:Mab-21-like HhH/H2TH-like domain-containing protein n=1 Tax=Mytilus galloprovincialis TaxID=29158 RepID=A0A8B6EQ59_MYTGA|nr:Hypothetical predicted protein [Mytilus galloprovincialis]